MDSKPQGRDVTVQKGVRIAVRRPSRAAVLFARTLTDLMDAEAWLDRTLKMRFCALFLHNMIDGSIEAEVDPELLHKLRTRPMTVGIRLFRRRPDQGLRLLVALVAGELRDYQHLPIEEQLEFYDEICHKFFPEIRLSDKVVERNLSASVSGGADDPRS